MLSGLERMHLGMDPATLEEELMVQSDIRGQYAEAEAEASEREANLKLAVEKAKERLLKEEGRLRLHLSKKTNWLDEDFDKAPTKDQTDAYIHNDASYIAIYDDYILERERLLRVQTEVMHAHGMVSSMDSKKKSLELLVSLYNGGYWADPKTDGGISGGKRNQDIGNTREDQGVEDAKAVRRDAQREKRRAAASEKPEDGKVKKKPVRTPRKRKQGV